MKFKENWLMGFRGEVFQMCLWMDDGRVDDGRQVITIVHREPSAQVS